MAAMHEAKCIVYILAITQVQAKASDLDGLQVFPSFISLCISTFQTHTHYSQKNSGSGDKFLANCCDIHRNDPNNTKCFPWEIYYTP